MGDLNILHTKRNKTDSSWSTWTWMQYYSEACAVAKSLIAFEHQPHEAVNLLAFNCPEWFFVAIGAILAGGMAAGIYTTNSPPAVKYIVEHSKCRLLFVDTQEQLDKAMLIRANCRNLRVSCDSLRFPFPSPLTLFHRSSCCHLGVPLPPTETKWCWTGSHSCQLATPCLMGSSTNG